jgi:hypothetical protein
MKASWIAQVAGCVLLWRRDAFPILEAERLHSFVRIFDGCDGLIFLLSSRTILPEGVGH